MIAQARLGNAFLVVCVLVLGLGPANAHADPVGPPYEERYVSSHQEVSPTGTATGERVAVADERTGHIDILAAVSDTSPAGLCCLHGVFPSSHSNAAAGLRHRVEIATAGNYQIRVTVDFSELRTAVQMQEPYLYPVRVAYAAVLVGLEIDLEPCGGLEYCYDYEEAELTACGGPETVACEKPPPDGPVTMTLGPVFRVRNFGTLKVGLYLGADAVVAGPGSASASAKAVVRSIEAVPVS